MEASSPWLAEAPSASALAPVILTRARHVVSYHLVTSGSCFCRLEGEAPVRLEAGDFVVIPHGQPYVLGTDPGARPGAPLDEVLSPFRWLAKNRTFCTVREGGGGRERIDVACGFLGCDAEPVNPVLAALPRLIHLRGADAPPGDRLHDLLAFALAEARAKRAGSDCVLLRISELMFVELVRRHVATMPSEAAGWLAGVRDDVVGRALALLHGEPARPWTVASLAKRAGCSRSAMAERFTQLVGEPPIQYLTRWRMQIAARLLAEGAKVSAVALDVGYDSEAAFSRAFKKAAGSPPSAWRARGTDGAT